MATKKQSSAKQSSDASAETEAAETGLHVELIGVDHGSPEGDMSVEARIDKDTGKIVDIKVIDIAALESRVAQADAAYAAAVSSVGSTADELREARAALREARGG